MYSDSDDDDSSYRVDEITQRFLKAITSSIGERSDGRSEVELSFLEEYLQISSPARSNSNANYDSTKADQQRPTLLRYPHGTRMLVHPTEDYD